MTVLNSRVYFATNDEGTNSIHLSSNPPLYANIEGSLGQLDSPGTIGTISYLIGVVGFFTEFNETVPPEISFLPGAEYISNLTAVSSDIYRNSLISANLYLSINTIATYSTNSTSFNSNINISKNTDLSYAGFSSLDFNNNTISGSLSVGIKNFNVTNIVSGLSYSSDWNKNDPISIAITLNEPASGLLGIDLKNSYINFQYNSVEPFAPQNITVEAGYKQIDVFWEPPLDDGGDPITEYILEYAEVDNFVFSEWTVAATTNQLSATVSNLNNDQQYIFRVAARNDVGIGEYSDNSEIISPDKSLAPRASNTFNDSNYARIRLRRDNSSNWSGVNPVLGLGEPGYETDTNLMKIGDNFSTWNDLPYLQVDNDSIQFPPDREVYFVVGDSPVNADSPRISLNLSQNEKINILARDGIDLEYDPGFNSLTFSLDQVFDPFNSGELYSPNSRGRPGAVNYSKDYLYLCLETNFWERIPLEKQPWFAPDSIAISLNSGLYPSVTNIYFSGFNALITSDGDPFPAKASRNLVNDGFTSRSDFFNNYQISDQDYNFIFRYRGGKNTHSPESSSSGYNGIFANGVLFADPSAGIEAIGIYNPPQGFHFNRTFFSNFFKVDDCGGYVNFERQYAYYDGKFLDRCWNDSLVYTNNSYYSGSNYNGDYFRHSDGHSKILGFCFDGYPIYGPFGYVDTENAASGTTLMTSSYIAKTGDAHRPEDWKYTNAITVNDINYNLTAGAFIEDFEYSEGSGLLDQYNGRYSITPEYPEGTYAYYLTFTSDSLLIPQYPYIIGNFSKEKKVKQDLVPSLYPITVDGYFPLFTETDAAENYSLLNGGDGTYTTYTIFGDIYYMPNGVSNINIPANPTDISLSENRISEKATLNAIIGVFSTVDENLGDYHTYTLVPGLGDDDNANFNIFNNELRVNTILSYGIQNSHNIRIRSTDQTNRFFEKSFTIDVLEGTSFTSLNITSGINYLLAGTDSHTFGVSTQGTASDFEYRWNVFSSPYVVYDDTTLDTLTVSGINIVNRMDESVNINLSVKSISAFTTLYSNTSFILDHSEQPQCIAGYYPLYSSQNDANRDPNGDGTSHMHTVMGVIYWMPNGLTEFYHGNFDCDSLTPSKTDICLDGSIDVTIANTGDGNRYVFDSNSSNTHRFKATTGTYVFNNVPSNHPIAFHNNGKPIAYSGTTSVGTKTALDGNTYNFYYGSVTGVFSGDFSTTSYECYYHGYMGGQDNLIYDNSCTSQTPTLTATQIGGLSSVNGGSSLTLTASKTGTATDVTYAWTVTAANGVTLSSSTGTSVNFNTTDLDQDADQNVTVTLIATSVSAGTSVTDSHAVTVVQNSDSSAPTLTSVTISSNTTVNGGSNVALSASIVGTATDVIYAWSINSVNGTALSSSSGSTTTLTTTDLNTDTDQTVIATVQASSVSASSTVSDTQTITIYQSADGGGGGGGY